MNALNQYQLNGLDLYQYFGWYVTDRTGSNTLLKYPTRKDPPSHDWRDENGIEYDLSDPVFEDAPFTLVGFMEATSKDAFWEQYWTFWAILKAAGELTLYVAEFDRNFKVYYKECSRVERLTRIKNTDRIGAKMDITFRNISVLDGGTVPPYNNEAILSRNISVDVPAGNITAGQVLLAGLGFTDYVAKLHEKVIDPTFIAETYALGQNQGSKEAGTVVNVGLSFAFGRGTIVEGWAGGVNKSLLGAAINYRFYNGSGALLQQQAGNFYTVEAVIVEDGNTTKFQAEVDYATGTQPVNNRGQNVGTPRAAGTSPRQTVFIPGFRYAFIGFDPANPRNSAFKIASPAAGNTITVNVPAGAPGVYIWYPATIRDFSKANGSQVLYVEDSNKNITDNFTAQPQVQIAGANGWAPINYKLSQYVPIEPYKVAATLSIKL